MSAEEEGIEGLPPPLEMDKEEMLLQAQLQEQQSRQRKLKLKRDIQQLQQSNDAQEKKLKEDMPASDTSFKSETPAESTSDSSPAEPNTEQHVAQRRSGVPAPTAPSTLIQLKHSSSTDMVTAKVPKQQNNSQQVSDLATVPFPQRTCRLPLWDSAHPEQQEIVAWSPRYKDLLKDKLPELTRFVQLPEMWVHLIALDVIDRLGRDRILHNVTQADAVERLVHYLESGATWKIHGFLRALAKTQQQEIIHLLGLLPADYEDPSVPPQPPSLDPPTRSATDNETKAQKRHYYKRVESDEMLPISRDLLPGLLQHCGSYNQTLMKASLFGYQKNVPIDLTRIYVCQDASCKANLREKLPVQKKELFQRLFATRHPKCLSLEGPAGTGKSSYLEEYAYDWSQDVTSCEERGPDVPCKGHCWKLVVYIAAGGIRGTAAEATKDNIRCEPHLKDQMMRSVDVDGDGMLIMYDAMDELRLNTSIDSISSFLNTSQKMVRKPRCLVSARDGLLSVDRGYFDRELHLEGFSLRQGVEYVKTYFKEMHSLTEHPVLEFVSENSQDLQWVLSNPLRVHIFSELTACGDLNPEDVKKLTTVKLFRSLDQLLLKRDKECRPTSNFEATRFYQTCLRALLTDTRTLSEEDVIEDSPYLSLLQRHNYRDLDLNNCSNFTFPHETLFEYFSMRGLIECLMSDVEYKQAILLWLCSNPKMRNVLQLTCGYIAQFVPQLLPYVVFIIRACLLMQTEHVWCEQNELTQELLQLPSLIQQTFPHDILEHGLTTQQVTTLGKISNQVQALFSENANLLRDVGWFLNGFRADDKGRVNEFFGPFHEFLLGCIQQLTPQQLTFVFCQTITHLLPCTRYKIPHIIGARCAMSVVPVGGVRWAAVEETDDDSELEVYITLWSPGDLLSTLDTGIHLHRVQQLHQRQELQQHQVRYYVGIDTSAHTLCTSLPADPWSEEQWAPGLRELLSPSYCAGKITIEMGGSKPPPPLSGLLSACRKVIPAGHGLCKGRLEITYGQVSEEDLTWFCVWAGEVELRLELWWLTVVLRAGCGEEDVKVVDSTIRRMMEVCRGGKLFCPTYVTPAGDVLCENYDPLSSDSEDSDLSTSSI